ncbi:hypothetical protein CVU82_00635 [Candidatus Falkowbacteria bacterium HGW-Falkowbacteria-1]|uniref:Polymerase/histidinol phosphatase N-terminal domain-containing protein n=1 Tax=Candidatus Falkowbacteria bacterium HGW-Falkowbacteria-1 TaxID=2013768 RepID=A0A2N2EAK1_9BACT|nr:MAG: hypothetical protein CVU82_00635 [Candidatus Falkowbacteria bacterium HGW-Falkowbacteria-1]
MIIDLQFHSVYSDGYLNPKDLARFVASRNVKVAALTDHNTLAGINEFKEHCQRYNIKVINGLELYCRYKRKTINILWYNFDDKNEKLLGILEETRKRRYLMVKKALLRLKKRGFRLNVDEILSEFKHYIPINRLAEKITKNHFNYSKIFKEVRIKNKFVKTLREEDILGVLFFNKKSDRLNESYINVERVVELKKEIGGQLIFCHPGKYNKYAGDIILKLRDMGVDGLEVLSPHHTVGAVMHAQFLAETLDMIASGGSDFHRFEEGENFKIRSFDDWFKIDSKYLRRIKEIIS